VTDLDERIKRLSGDRRRLLEFLRADHAPDGIPRRPSGTAPASFGQQRFWFMDQVRPGDRAYQCPSGLRLSGRLDTGALCAAVDRVVARHEVLRTVYRPAEGGGEDLVEQVVMPARTGILRLTDLSGSPAGAAAARVGQALRGDATFDLAAGPVFRAELFRLDEQTSVLVCNAHHIAFDGWSVALLYGELAAAYRAGVSGVPAESAELTIQYADFAVWQRTRVTPEIVDRQIDYWRTELAGATAPVLCPDRRRAETPTDNGGFVHADLPAETVRRLGALAAECGASLFAVLAAGLGVLIGRCTERDDVIMGTAVLARDRPEAAALIGCFINTVVLRVRLDGEAGFRTLVERTGAAVRRAVAHGDVPFEQVISALRPEREPGRTPLISFHITLDESGAALPDFPGVKVEAAVPELDRAKFDFGFNVRTLPSGAAMVGVIHRRDRFSRALAERLLGHFLTLLTDAVERPDARWSDLELLSPAVRREMLVGWNDTAKPYPGHLGLHQLVEARTDETPGAPAVSCAGTTLDYRELDGRANRIARVLAARGVGSGDLVGIALPRSLDLPAAILGVLKTGAAYVPIDPEYPAERIRFLLGDCRPGSVLTTDVLRARIGAVSEAAILSLDDPEFLRADSSRPRYATSSEDRAYVIYTSGSTGRPKGAVLTHRGVANSLLGINELYGIGPGDTVLALASPSFDASVYDIVGTLVVGGKVALVSQDGALDPASWPALIDREKVTVWHSVPALTQLLVERLEATGARLRTLRTALLSGDWIPLGLPDRFRSVVPGLRFISMGGATEVSVDSFSWSVAETDQEWASVPYGRPLPNQRAYILDDRLHPVPVGVPGMLHIAGLGVGLGYLGQPELTARQFITADLGEPGVERLYRTGDRARFDADGVVELLGRIDNQLKVRGLRVEPGEIESLLRRHPAIRDAVVVLQGDGDAARLVCCCVPAEHGPAVDELALRDWLGGYLPRGLVPSGIAFASALPLTPNNKVDRAAVAAMDFGRRSARPTAWTEPEGDLERRIAAIWSTLLGVSPIGRDDDFFDLGGDSYRAIRAVTELGGSVSLVDMFTHATVRGLAEHMNRPKTAVGLLRLLSAHPESGRLALVGIPYGGGGGAAFGPLSRELSDDFVLYAVGLPGHDLTEDVADLLPLREAAVLCADEIQATVDRPLVLYGHCAGVAFTLELAWELERRGLVIEVVYLAAALPDPDPDASLRRSSEDAELYAALSDLGAFSGPLEESQLRRLLTVARHDLLEALRTFQRGVHDGVTPLAAPIRLVFGDADPATADHGGRADEWSAFGQVLSVDVIAGGDHYFLGGDAARLAELLTGYARAAEGAPHSAPTTTAGDSLGVHRS
jgi:amino acid adenylation domain-containing protein